MFYGRSKLAPATYYTIRARVTGSNWQHKQYRAAVLNCVWPTLSDEERELLVWLNVDNFHPYRNHPLVKRICA